MAYDAVLRNLAVVGEAVKSLPEEFKLQHVGTPWASIAGLRNVVIQEYFGSIRDDPRLRGQPVGTALGRHQLR